MSHQIFISILTTCYSLPFCFIFVLSPSIFKEYVFLSINVLGMNITVYNSGDFKTSHMLKLFKPSFKFILGFFFFKIFVRFA